MPPLALLANPDSGSGDATRVAECLREHGAEVISFPLDRAGDAVAASPDRMVVAGGDGSLACVAAPAGQAGVPVAVVPTGTANDFARALELPTDLSDACRLAASGERTRTLDLAWMERRPFLNVASLGLPPAAARRAASLKDRLGPLAYAVGALRAGIGADPVVCSVSCDGESVHSGPAWQVTVACSGAFGAGSEIGADPTDGLLDVVVVAASNRLQLVRHAYSLRRGEAGAQPAALQRRCRTARVEIDRPVDFNVDGEIVTSGSCEFRSEPRAFSVVVG